MKIAVLGTGHMGTTLATALIGHGHDVVFGSRHPAGPHDLRAPVSDHRTAIDGSDVVVSALAAAHSLETLTPLAGALSGKVLIDIGNAVSERFELIYDDSSLGERLQKALPGTRVVKTLNTVGGPIGVNPSLLPSATDVFLSGDDADAKATVSSLLSQFGWAPEHQVDLGGISTARAVESYFLLFAGLMRTLGTPVFNIAIVR